MFELIAGVIDMDPDDPSFIAVDVVIGGVGGFITFEDEVNVPGLFATDCCDCCCCITVEADRGNLLFWSAGAAEAEDGEQLAGSPEGIFRISM